MHKPVHQFLLQCRPSLSNRHYHSWQTARVVLFVADYNWKNALHRSSEILAKERWMLIETHRRATLIDEEVRKEGGDVLNAYFTAQVEGHWIKVFPDHFAAGKKGIAPMRPPRIGEAFVDRVVENAGGRRLSPAETNYQKTRNSDYLVDDFIYELKDLQEEGLEKPERQAKLAELFRPYHPGKYEIQIDPSILTPEDLFRYAKIVGGPLHKAVRSAADQIKATKLHLRNPELKGGILVLNSGYFSLPHETFVKLLLHYIHNDTSQIESTVCMTVGFTTNGFNNWLNSRFHPSHKASPTEDRLGNSFGEMIGAIMTEWSRAGFKDSEEPVPLPVPIVFEHKGIRFHYMPDCIPPPWSPEAP